MVRMIVLAAILVLRPAANAQSAGAAGELQGSVLDPSDALVAAAVVSVVHRESGLARKTITDAEGAYRVLQLPPGAYDVRVEKEAFRTQLIRDVQVTVGQVATLDIRLQLGMRTDIVEVSGAPELVEVERPHQAVTLEQTFVRHLPIDRRDYLTFALLAPSVADATALADNADFRAAQTPTSGLSFFGSNGRGNSVLLDGSEANTDAGGVRPTITQEAVQEFQINLSNFSAEFGMASGGLINIISKSGTNALRGSAFGFFRTDALDAGDPFANVFRDGSLERVKPPGDRQQFGATLGLPLVKDRTFLFGGFEHLRREESSAVSVLTDASIFGPTPEQNRILERLPASDAARLRAALTSSQSTIDLFTLNSGVFPFATRDWKWSIRADHQRGSADQYIFRYAFSRIRETNANVRALVGASRGTRIRSFDSTASAGWTHAWSGRLLNEARFQWNYRNFLVSSIEEFGPEINILGFGYFNRDYSLPSNSIGRRYEIKDAITYSRGAHTVKAGGQVLLRGLHSESHTFFAGRFTFGGLPGSLLHPVLAGTSLTAVQAFNLGLAQAYQQGFGDPTITANLPFYGVFIQDSWKVRHNLTLDVGVRYELDVRLRPLPRDANNIAPRFSFAWDPFADRKTTVRGGYGVFYSPVYFQIDYVVNALGVDRNGTRPIAQVFSSIQTPGAAAANNVFSTLQRQGIIGVPVPQRSITAADIEQFGFRVSHTGPVPPGSVLFENSPDYANAYAQQASFGVERAVTQDLSVSANYILVRTLKLPRARDKNLLPAPVDSRLGIRVWSTPYFVDPAIAQFNVYESTANAFYNGVVLELRRRFSRGFTLNANYSFSKAIDEVTDYNSDYSAFDQTNQRAEHALSAFDQQHKFVVYGLWAAPRGFDLSAILRANSGRPFNLLAGTDLNQDRHSTTDRPAFAGRNTGIGPSFWTVDVRLARRFDLGEARALEAIAEGFNVLNRLNAASINNTVGNMPPPFRVHGRADRSPSEPLGFTSAFDPRRIQLGLRFVF